MIGVVVTATGARAAEADRLAAELGLPRAAETDCTLQLHLAADWLELRNGDLAIHCDFLGGRLGYRRVHGGGRGQGLTRAIGLKKGATPSVVDATAGLGRDGFMLADLGCAVTLLERTPATFALLRDGLIRAAEDEVTGAMVAARVKLHCIDALAYLQGGAPSPDVVYLDPMHPTRGSNALVKKEMRLIRAAAGDDADAAALLPAARAFARERVVVKRPARSEPLGGQAPDWSITGKTTRFDVYRTAGDTSSG